MSNICKWRKTFFTEVLQGKVSQCVSGKKKSCKGYVFEEFPIAVTKRHFPEEEE